MLAETLATGAALGATGGLFGYLNNERNIDMQRETNAANYQLWKENIYQEDHAIRRRKLDLQAAGLSPVLAAGQGASTPSAIKMDAPKSEDWMGAAANQGLQSILASTQVSKTQMDNQRTAAEIGKIGAETDNIKKNTLATDQNMKIQNIMTSFQTKAISAQTAEAMVRAAKLEYEKKIAAVDAGKSETTGVTPSSSGVAKNVSDTVNFGKKFLEKLNPAGNHQDLMEEYYRKMQQKQGGTR